MSAAREGRRSLWPRCLAVAAVVAGLSLAAWILLPLPEALLAPSRAQSLMIQDRYGLPLRATRASDGSLMEWVTLQRMAPALPQAFVAVEDRRFFQHHGIDARAVARAIRDNLAGRRIVSGASTISMQLARLLRPVGRGFIGKLIQSAWALRLEAHLTKGQILEQYLNRVPLGQGAVGVASAMRLYFGASATQASLGEAAMLAALAHAPSSQNPLVAPGRAAARRALGLEALAAQGYASREEVVRAEGEPLLGPNLGRPFLAPHFTSRLLQWAEEQNRPLAGTWRTSLDLGLQQALEDEVRHTVDQLADRGVRQAAAVVIDNRSGELLAWVGSPDFWADSAGQVDMVVSRRQPGSALKPFLYALAFDRGTTAATVLPDVARTYQTAGGPYHPRNYDRQYHGPVRVREALASSYNVPAVELTDRIGYATLLHGLHQAGFESLDHAPEHYGLGLALGNGDVTLLELANGYRALANGGLWTATRWWAGDKTTADGAGVRVVSARAAALTLDILADADARIPGFGLRTPFDWPFRAAAKTGTSRHFTDNWAVAVTEGFTVAVWAGNFTGRPMEGVSGISGAGPLLHRAVLVTAARYAPGDLPGPTQSGLVPVTICRVSGLLASPECPGVTEYFVPGTAPDKTCDWHRDGSVRLPVEYAEWAATSLPPSLSSAGPRPPESQSGVRGDRRLPDAVGGPVAEPAPPDRLEITSPQQGDHYRIPPGVEARYASIAFRATGARSAARIRWYVDGRRMMASRWALVPGDHEVQAESGSERAVVRITVDQP